MMLNTMKYRLSSEPLISRTDTASAFAAIGNASVPAATINLSARVISQVIDHDSQNQGNSNPDREGYCYTGNIDRCDD